MKKLAELRRIVDSQKTVSTKRLVPLLDAINKSYVQSGQHNIELAKQKHISSQLALRLSASMMKNDGTL
ncbi:hypothetical protein J7E55_07860 [Bacillus sp. ISL-53]|nr:hypothetical protein [Bacillus sp. ISL-53]